MNDVQAFLQAQSFAVAGASVAPHKYGHQVLRALRASGRVAFAVNPNHEQVAGQVAYASLRDLPGDVEAVSIVTPPEVTRQVIRDAIAEGVKHVWMQPGAEDEEGSELARQQGLNVIDDGSCILVLLAREAG